ncbi:DsbA family protein [Kushneria pakistanensis]|uniref:DsbA family protein n=1 Tax=Kushneria pakistanensis TaxID=1508770 RepID=A0ABQ3FA69_9GAMM|nr:DsbA family protein [Kushneria pakistanensis]GHC15556.1 DsbA family protein [Kushneria pakistanensis]
MPTTLTYLFDPLCGWCYGASGVLPTLLTTTGLTLSLQPTGLFSEAGARAMDASFADYAWQNDQRIARLTKQTFSERYRQQVLEDRSQIFDSGPATVALTAVHLTAPEREFDALKAIQHARYVDGDDITRMETLAPLLRTLGLDEAAVMLASPQERLLRANRERTRHGQALMSQVGARGVPTLLLSQEGRDMRLLDASALFSNPDALARELAEVA